MLGRFTAGIEQDMIGVFVRLWARRITGLAGGCTVMTVMKTVVVVNRMRALTEPQLWETSTASAVTSMENHGLVRFDKVWYGYGKGSGFPWRTMAKPS
jgi:hypothetical protein